MNKLFLDIETIPCDEEHRAEFTAILRKKIVKDALGNPVHVSDIETEEQTHHKTGLDGTFGRICCIAYIKETDNSAPTRGVLSGDETKLLQDFWQLAKDVKLFVGHNIFEFDLPFIYKRSIILNVIPTQEISFAKYRNNPIYDTQNEWERWAYARQKLDTLAKVLGLPTSKDLMDGSEVWQYFKDGKLKEICEYCMKDVVLNRQVYYRMNYQEVRTD